MTFSLDLDGFENLFIVSDLHMGDGTQKDNFQPFKSEFLNFLQQEVFNSKNNRLILAGDTFEFWQSFHSTIVMKNFDILKTLIENGAIFIVGNHDIDLIDFVGASFDLKFLDLLSGDLQFEILGKKFFVCHGHEFDKYNDPGRHLVWGRMSALFAGWVEMRVGREIDGTLAEEVLLLLGKQILGLAKWIIGRYLKTPSQEKKVTKIIPDYIDEAGRAREKKGVDFVISGHTHLPGVFEDWYINSGSWQKRPLTYVKISKEAKCGIYEWPSRKGIDVDLSSVKQH